MHNLIRTSIVLCYLFLFSYCGTQQLVTKKLPCNFDGVRLWQKDGLRKALKNLQQNGYIENNNDVFILTQKALSDTEEFKKHCI